MCVLPQGKQVVKVRKEGLAGHIHSVHLVDFMCHENFLLELGWVFRWAGGGGEERDDLDVCRVTGKGVKMTTGEKMGNGRLGLSQKSVFGGGGRDIYL